MATITSTRHAFKYMLEHIGGPNALVTLSWNPEPRQWPASTMPCFPYTNLSDPNHEIGNCCSVVLSRLPAYWTADWVRKLVMCRAAPTAGLYAIAMQARLAYAIISFVSPTHAHKAFRFWKSQEGRGYLEAFNIRFLEVYPLKGSLEVSDISIVHE